MTPVEWLAFLLNALVACSALPVQEQHVQGQDYLIQSWTCQFTQGPVMVKAISPQCDTGHTKYWGRVAFLEFEAPYHLGVYRNRFGEFQMEEGAMFTDAYQGPCGS